MNPMLVFYAALTGVFGLAFGSFSGVVVGRSPLTVRALIPASRCDSCAAPIRWYQNIPVISWIWLKGRCAVCQSKIPVWSPALELCSGLIFAVIALLVLRVDSASNIVPQSVITTAFAALFASNLLCAAIIGYQRHELPRLLLVSGILWGSFGIGWQVFAEYFSVYR